MEKTKPEQHFVEIDALTSFVYSLFSDIMVPPLHSFLHINKIINETFKAPTFTIDPNASQDPSLVQALEGQAILFLHSGTIELQKKTGRHWQREIEHKQGSFFALINYKNLMVTEPQRYHLIAKTKSVISVIAIKPEYGYHWIRQNIHKNLLLAKIFFYNDTGIEIERKKKRFKDYISLFQSEVFRRDTRFLSEGRKNEKIFVISRGEAKICKQLHVKTDSGYVTKNVEILYLSEGSVIGNELLLINSKSVQTIINNHASKNKTIKEQPWQEQKEQVKEDSKRKRKEGRNHGKIQIEEGGYELYKASENRSNFTFVAESANLEVYYIGIDELVSNITERNKINFLKFSEQTYVTILRRTHQKMVMQSKIERDKLDKTNIKINAMAAKAYSSVDFHSEANSHISQKINIKKSQIVVSGALDPFRARAVQHNHQKNLQKRTELIIREVKPKTNFVKKIEQILETKLSQARNSQQTEVQLVKDLGEIFMKNNEGRTEDIEKHHCILEKKNSILAKMGGWQPGWDKLKQEGAIIPPKPQITPNNYLQGLNMQDYTCRVKQICVAKIHEANKIKEQFMRVKAECKKCTCYQNFDNLAHRHSVSSFTRTAYKTSQGWGRASRRSSTPGEQPPLQTVYNSMRFLSERSKQKYNHNVHLLKMRRNKDKLQRRKSAPTI